MIELTGGVPLGFALGAPLETNIARAIEDGPVEGSALRFHEFFWPSGRDDVDPVKMESMVCDGECVAVRLLFTDPSVTYSFAGVPIDFASNGDSVELAKALEASGLRTIVQYNGLVLPDDYITLKPRDWIMWWDPSYWDPEGFRDSAIAL